MPQFNIQPKLSLDTSVQGGVMSTKMSLRRKLVRVMPIKSNKEKLIKSECNFSVLFSIKLSETDTYTAEEWLYFCNRC